MSIVRKWATARAEVIDDDGVSWIAECRAGTGTWVIREDDAVHPPADDLGREAPPCGIRGAMFGFVDGGLPLSMTTEQRAWIGMTDLTYHELNVMLRESRRQ